MPPPLPLPDDRRRFRERSLRLFAFLGVQDRRRYLLPRPPGRRQNRATAWDAGPTDPLLPQDSPSQCYAGGLRFERRERAGASERLPRVGNTGWHIAAGPRG